MINEYGAYRDHFEALLQGRDTAETDFVDADTGWTTQVQPLHIAERKYGPEQDPNRCGNCLQGEWWEGLNMSIGFESNNLGYWNPESAERHYVERQDNNDEAVGYDTPWRTANAGNRSNAVSDDSPEFEGGFAGNCPEGQTWTYVREEGDDFGSDDADWECRGASDGDPTGSITGSSVTILQDLTTTAYLPMPDTSNGEMTVGITLFPFNNQPMNERPDYLPDDLSSQISHYGSVSENGGEIESASVACWSGGLDNKPNDVTSSSRAFYQSDIDLGTNDPVTRTGTVDASDYNGYACQWEYEVTDYSDPVKGEAEDVIALHTRENQQYLEQMRNPEDENVEGVEVPE